MEGEAVPCHSQGKQSRIHKKVLNIFLFDAESEGALTARGKRRGEFMKPSEVEDSRRLLTRGQNGTLCHTQVCDSECLIKLYPPPLSPPPKCVSSMKLGGGRGGCRARTRTGAFLELGSLSGTIRWGGDLQGVENREGAGGGEGGFHPDATWRMLKGRQTARR